MYHSKKFFILIACLLLPHLCLSQTLEEKLKAVGLTYTSHEDSSQPYIYRLFTPGTANSTAPFPLVIYLHGAGGQGADNNKQITGGNLYGSCIWAIPENQAINPCFVCAPQQEGGWEGPKVIALANMLIEEHNLDQNRIYLTGQSMGGYGTWITIITDPDFFAAAIPVCGAGQANQAEQLFNSETAIWPIHGEADSTVSVNGSRDMVQAIETAGTTEFVYTHINWQTGSYDTLVQSEFDAAIAANPRFVYSEFEGVGHSSWIKGYTMPQLQVWLFMQKKDVTEVKFDPVIDFGKISRVKRDGLVFDVLGRALPHNTIKGMRVLIVERCKKVVMGKRY